MDIAILLYEGFTALDAIGPYETLGRVPGAKVTFVATATGPVRTDQGSLAITADATLDELAHPDILVIPGGPGTEQAMGDEATLAWLRAAHETSTWTTSVCTGSLILAAAGILDGVPATSHWQAFEVLELLGAIPTHERVVIEGKIVTAAGVSAGIDMGLTLAALLAGDHVAQSIQLGIEYDPQPPFNAGSPDTAPAEVVEFMWSGSRFREIA